MNSGAFFMAKKEAAFMGRLVYTSKRARKD
jgi:hypothetical protein